MDKKYIIGQANIANDPTAVKFTPQSLTSEQKVQAQTNIGLNDIQLVKTNDLEYTLKVGGIDSGTINIPKDQFLKSVEFDPDTKILTFVFTTSTGDVTTTIDMSALIDVYTAGNGLLLVGNQFSINLDGNSNNSLTISADGLMLDKTQLASTAEFQNLSEQVTDNTAQIETLNSNYVKSPVETSAFINGQNTLKDAQPTFSVESNNRFDYDSITPKMDYGSFSKIQGGYFVQGADGGAFDVAYANGWLVFNMSLSKGDIISFDYEVLSLMKPEWNKFAVTINPMNLSKNEYGLAVGSSGRFIWEIPEDGVNDWVFRVGGLGVNITNICISKVTDTYTPYLADGTAVTVRKANKNLAYFNNGTSDIMSVSDNVFTINGQTSINYGFTKEIYLGKGTYAITCEYISGTVSNGGVWIRVGTSDNANKYISYAINQQIITSKIDTRTFSITNGEKCLFRIYGNANKPYDNFKFIIQLEV